MNDARSALYKGTVGHRRLQPVRHAFRYRVFSLMLDCDEIDALDRGRRFFSHNRFNLFSLHDRDHGDGGPLADYLARIATESGHRGIKRFLMLGYPRVFGYAFNPITIYFGLDAEDRTALIVYEVNNTFGQRQTYVLPAAPDARGDIDQSCRKRLYVSPFNTSEGRYRFRVSPIGEEISVCVSLADERGPIMSGWFKGERSELTDSTLLRALFSTGWMTIKVTAAIHFEAFRLWWKGLRIVRRPPAPAASLTYVAGSNEK
jgi:DUF1365 family protein